jgi:HD-GYP domain-containing protein (c-di-GMP phosphodiesterase class II)
MPQQSNTTIHRLLISRLVISAIVVSLLVSSLVIYYAKGSVSEIAVDRSLQGAMNINVLAADILNEPGLPRRNEMQALINRVIPYRQQNNYASGQYVFVLIKTLDGSEIARLSDRGVDTNKAINAIQQAALPVPQKASQVHHTLKELDNKFYVLLTVPLVTRQNDVAAYVEAIFAVSEKEINKVKARRLRAILISIGIVLLTTLLLYPTIVRLLNRVTRMSRQLLDANLETIQLLGSAIAKRDSDTDIHNYRVSIYSVRLAEKLGLTPAEIQSLIKGAFLHDVGKLGIRDNILLKPGRLDKDEFEEMKNHVQHGMDIVARSSWLQDAEEVVGHHHQKFDGSGYFGGKQGKDIPLNARIFAVADVFDALTSRRPYKEPMSFEKAMSILQEGSETHFDPDVLEAFQAIAHTLYEMYGRGDEDRARQDLENIIETYFRQDAALLLD